MGHGVIRFVWMGLKGQHTMWIEEGVELTYADLGKREYLAMLSIEAFDDIPREF